MNSFSRGDEYIYITHLPNYKKPVLAIGTKCVIDKIGSFDSEEDAERFYQILKTWFNLDEKETM